MIQIQDPKWTIFKEPVPYNDAIKNMSSTVDRIRNNQANNEIWLIEHYDVYTKGVSAKDSDIINSTHIPIIHSNRGGQVTYHGLGQRVIYPILNISSSKDISLYIKALQTWIIKSLERIGINAFTIHDQIGVWVRKNNENYKIAAIGVRFKKWIAYHGVALNVATNLSHFYNIIPCGIKNSKTTSIKEMGLNISFEEIDKILQEEFYNTFSVIESNNI